MGSCSSCSCSCDQTNEKEIEEVVSPFSVNSTYKIWVNCSTYSLQFPMSLYFHNRIFDQNNYDQSYLPIHNALLKYLKFQSFLSSYFNYVWLKR